MKYLILLLLPFSVYASGTYYQPPVVTNVTELTNVTNQYYYDKCQGVAIAQAGANNQMYLGTNKPQLSLGVGECSGEVAGSLMFGMKPWKNGPLINGSIAIDENVEALGLGSTWILK